MNRRTFIKVAGGLLAMLSVGNFSMLMGRGSDIKVIETGSGYRVIFPNGKALDTNETGLIVLHGIQTGKSPEAIAEELASLTNESYERILYDFRNFVHNLKVVGIV